MLFFLNPVSHPVIINWTLYSIYLGFPGGLVRKSLPAVQETWVRSLGWEDPLEEEMAAHSSILAWRIPWMAEPYGLWGHRVSHD